MGRSELEQIASIEDSGILFPMCAAPGANAKYFLGSSISGLENAISPHGLSVHSEMEKGLSSFRDLSMK